MRTTPPSLKLVLHVLLVLLSFISTKTYAQGANCAAATLLTVNAAPITGTISDATVNDPAAAACAGGGVSRDGWYRFVATNTTATVTVSSTNRQLVIYAYSGICTGLTQINCANTNTAAGAQVETMNLTGLTALTTYYIRVVNSANNNMNLDAVSVSSPPSNNTCASATNLPCGTTNLAGTTVGTTSITNNTGCSISDYGVWYTFVGDGQQTTITSTAGAGYDHEMSVSSGSCGALTNLACEDSGLSGGVESFTFTTVAATTYYVYIADYASGSTTTGTFTISRSCAPAPVPPANNLCTNATVLPCGTTNLAGTTVNTANIVHGSGCLMSNYGVWYTFVGDGNPTTITTNPAFDIKLSISTGTCASMTNIVCTDISPETATFTTVLGTTYYVYVAYWTSGTTTGTFTISRSCITCAPPTATAATNITFTTATVNWTAPTAYTPSNGYQYAITTSATPPGSGTATTATSINATGLTANTLYYLHVRSDCGAINGFSTWSTISFTTGYCSSTSTSTGNYISNFTTVGGTANITNATGYSATGYGNFIGLAVSKEQLGSVSFSTTLVGGSSGFNIWIDWNNDFDFNDANELVFASGNYVTAASGTFTVPITATIGNHRMRIRSDFNSTNPSYCGSISAGETEDYTFTVLAPLPCSQNPSAVTSYLNSQTSVTLSWSAAAPVPASGYQYFNTTNANAPSNATAPTGATASTVTSATITGLTPGTTYYFWVRSNCGGTGSGTWIGPTRYTMPTCAVGPGTGTTSLGCPQVVSGGLGLNGADPASIACGAGSTCTDLEASYLSIGNTTSYTVQSIPYAPPYQFNCLRNQLNVTLDDRWSDVVNLPFDFCFYGTNYNQCLISANGVITFDLVNNQPLDFSTYVIDDNLPNPNLYLSSIFGVYQDINPALGGEIGWELITLNTGCRALVASWSNVPMFSCTTNIYRGMMILYENTNIIEVYINNKQICSTWNGGNAIVGVQNGNGTIATVAPNRNGLSADWTATNEAWRFTPSGPSISTITWYEGSGTSGPVVGTTDVINVCPATTTTYTAEIEYSLCNGTSLIETDEVTVTVSGNKIWDGSTSTDWNVASNWTPVGVPTSTDCVVIPDVTNDPVIVGTNFNGLGRSLAVNANAFLNITASNSATITDAINVNPTGTLIVQDDASIIQTNNVPNVGNIQYRRTANVRRQDYVYWSSPVAGFANSAVSPGTGLGFQYKWTPTIPTNTNFFGNWAFANETMVIGKGYCLRAPDSFSYSVAANYTATFIGVPNNGNIVVPISRGTYNGPNYSTGVSTTLGTQEDDNWNLVGNPYPSAIHAINFLTLNTNIAGFINVWSHGTLPSTAIADPFYANYTYNYTPTDYITYNALGSTPPGYNGRIAGGQGFFVSMLHTSTATTENLNFNNSLRSSAYNNSQFYRNSSENNTTEGESEEKHRIWFDLVTPSGTNVKSLLGYASEATNEKDRLYDAFSNQKLSFNIFSLIDEEHFLIQGRKLPFDTNDQVKIGVSLPQDGLYKIALSQVDGLFLNPQQNIYLEDKTIGIIFNLREAPYSFIDKKGTITDRFVIRYKKSTENTIELTNQLTVYDNSVMTIESGKLKIKNIEIFDTLGKLLLSKNNVNLNTFEVNNLNRTNSLMIVKVTLEDNSEEVRKIIY
ncbi:GEVED domain-containing protein [Flavobacterium difficile]|uniref:Fibronectin type III domain-containing protein n=1 Tax=Flavobacterium difficile TaxID=2709659 RepID=A0ABX0I503_9FLAO|nr:GEVED domain-containing protein [Flavobacterium difficile]NHM00837.1 fibronectin type III domain-containing protein [Flavobacterium difficile]